MATPQLRCDDKKRSLHVISIHFNLQEKVEQKRRRQACTSPAHRASSGLQWRIAGKFRPAHRAGRQNFSVSKCRRLFKSRSRGPFDEATVNRKKWWKTRENRAVLRDLPVYQDLYQSRNHSSVVFAHVILDVAKSRLVFLDTMVFWEGGVKPLHLGDFIFVVDYHVADVTLWLLLDLIGWGGAKTSRRLRFVCVCFYVFATLLTFHEFMLRCCYDSAFLSKWVVCGYNYIHTQSYIYYTNLFIDSSNLRDNTLDNHMCSYIYVYMCIITYIYTHRCPNVFHQIWPRSPKGAQKHQRLTAWWDRFFSMLFCY